MHENLSFYISRFEEVFLDPSVLAACRKWVPGTLKVARGRDKSRITYLPVPWNEGSAHLIQSYVNQWNRTWAMRLKQLGVDIKLKIAWQLGGSALKLRLMKGNSLLE